MKTYNKILACIWVVMLLLFFCGCDASVTGDTTHTVQGEATVRVVVGIDVTACEGLNPEDKLKCIQAIVDLAKSIESQNKSASDDSLTTQ